MDERRAEEILDQLIAWGLAEEGPDGEVGPTRRWVARMQAAAEKLNQMVARHEMPKGNPLVLAVSHALAQLDLAKDEALHQDCVRVLVTMELSRMTPSKRAQYGFSDLAL